MISQMTLAREMPKIERWWFRPFSDFRVLGLTGPGIG
jgi:hypothetical protein